MTTGETGASSNAASSYLPRSQSRAGSTKFTFNTYNMCAVYYKCRPKDANGNSLTNPVDTIVFMNAISGSLTGLGVQEECHEQYDQILWRSALSGKPLHGYNVTTVMGRACPEDSFFGNAVYSNAPVSTPKVIRFPTQENNPCVMVQACEYRSAICMKVTTYLGVTVPCSAHLHESLKAEQSAELHYMVSIHGTIGSYNHTYLGDFNGDTDSLHSSYQGMQNLSHFLSHNAQHWALTRRIDHMYLANYAVSSPFYITSVCDNTSDHCYVRGGFTVFF